MGKYLSKYHTQEDYNNNKDTHVKPHISYIINPTKQMIYIPKIKLITFYIIDPYINNIKYQYQAEEGMTWEEWINSEYNTDGFYISQNFICNSDGWIYTSELDKVILNNTKYRLERGAIP